MLTISKPVQCGTNICIFKYIQIYLDEYIHLSKYSLIFSKAKILIYTDKYIQIFIHPISMIVNIFDLSLFPKNG